MGKRFTFLYREDGGTIRMVYDDERLPMLIIGITDVIGKDLLKVLVSGQLACVEVDHMQKVGEPNPWWERWIDVRPLRTR